MGDAARFDFVICFMPETFFGGGGGGGGGVAARRSFEQLDLAVSRRYSISGSSALRFLQCLLSQSRATRLRSGRTLVALMVRRYLYVSYLRQL